MNDTLIDEAIVFLVDRGVVIPNRDAALELANDTAIDECITKMEDSIGGFHSFDGDDCCEDCSGWNGKSHRCECGNRRMYWEAGWDCTFKNMYVFPTAY